MRQPSVVTPEKVDEVPERMEASQNKSLRRFAQQVHCSYSSARKAVKTLKLYPYKIQAVHQLLEPYKEKRTCAYNMMVDTFSMSFKVIKYVKSRAERMT